MRGHIVIGSRGSDLALYQAHLIQSHLSAVCKCDISIKIIKTAGDRIDSTPFDQMEGKGFFTKELEDSLLSGEIDVAVHSLKDLMTTQPAGLKLGAVGFRVDRRELLLIRRDCRAGEGVLPVKAGAVVGTSAARRKAQVAALNPNVRIVDLRGNVPTRINRLREGKYDAIVIAAAGVERLKLDVSDLEVICLAPETFLPAPAQGILGIQIRSDDPAIEAIVSRLNDPRAELEARLERGLLAMFNSGCSLPLGVLTEISENSYRLKAVLGVRDGAEWLAPRRVEITGTAVEQILADAYRGLTN
ncbi:MAG: hydroxymethylbilane synthase [candidate division Zixibacteria bacterium]|nr:hydroxymethylbilane synthase [candidate division Zixibacteria bacterium]